MSWIHGECLYRNQILIQTYHLYARHVKVFIEEALAIFGDVYELLCDIHGIHKNQKAEQQRNVAREHSVFSDMMCLARQAHRQKLKH